MSDATNDIGTNQRPKMHTFLFADKKTVFERMAGAVEEAPREVLEALFMTVIMPKVQCASCARRFDPRDAAVIAIQQFFDPDDPISSATLPVCARCLPGNLPSRERTIEKLESVLREIMDGSGTINMKNAKFLAKARYRQ